MFKNYDWNSPITRKDVLILECAALAGCGIYLGIVWWNYKRELKRIEREAIATTKLNEIDCPWGKVEED